MKCKSYYPTLYYLFVEKMDKMYGFSIEHSLKKM